MTEVGLYFSNHSQSGHFHVLFLMVYKSRSRGHAGTVQGASSVPKQIIYTVPLSAVYTEAISHHRADGKAWKVSIYC